MPAMGNRVLVIDDDQGLRATLQKFLSEAGYQVETVDRGAAGLQKLLTEDFNLVFIDINMPEISGPAVCSALRKHEKTRRLPVVMITATYHSPEQIAQAKADYGPDAFLMKPFSAVSLRKLVEHLIPRTGNGAAEAAAAEYAVQQLKGEGIPRLLHKLYRKKHTGLLHLQHGEAKKIIYLKEGYPIFARSNVLNECLGRMLVREGVITEVDCDASVERSRDSGRLQGTVLIEMGLLTPQQLHEALARQVTEKLLNTFGWQDGTSQLVAGKTFKKNISTIRLSPAALILQGITRFWGGTQLDQYLIPLRTKYLKQSSDPQYRFQEIELSKRGEAIFSQCLGVATLEQILDQHPLARREVQQVLAALLMSEMIEASDFPEAIDAADIPEFRLEPQVDEILRRKILADYQQIMQADYFKVLGVSRQCGGAEVRRAYYKLAKEYHPDRFLGSGLSREMSGKINEIFHYVTQAYSVLSDPKTCSEYLDELVNGPRKTININQVIEAETAFQEGRALLKIRRYGGAIKPLKRSIELSPEEPEYLTHYAWALFKASPEKPEAQQQALEVLLASRELNPSLDITHLYLGHIYQMQGKDRQAEKSFEMAVQANPDCTEALRELRLINLRREQAPNSRGLLKKFMSKDD
jgi:DNA-binding response OmpR family regulator/curved DNA-binding protein CbpA